MFSLHKDCSFPPVIHKEIDCEKEEEDIGHLEKKKNEVEVDKLWSVEECRPYCASLTVFLPLVTPWIAKKALSYTHAGEDQVARAKLVH